MSALGTEFKLNVHVEPIDGMHMSEYDFECVFFVYKNRPLVVKKNEMTKVDEDNYIAKVDSAKVGVGNLLMKFVAEIPDSDMNDGLRKEVELEFEKLSEESIAKLIQENGFKAREIDLLEIMA